MDILKLAQEHEAYMIEHRRYIHENAEVSNHEEGTVAYVAAELTRLGIEHIVVPNGGILGFIEGPQPGKTVMLRGDMDALPMQESPDNLKGPKVAVSKNDGACHSCGHDGHTAMLLAAGKILNENKSEIKGKVILLFERGEESTGNLVYLLKYIEDNKIHIDSAWGIHLYAQLASGKISLVPGPVMAGNVGFQITIKGRGGHGSRPDQSVSPIEAFAAMVDGMARIRMQNVNPFSALTYSIGYVKSGTVANIIPETLEFGGTARLFDIEAGTAFRNKLSELMEHVGKAYDCEITGALRGPSFAVINDAECANLAKEAVGKAIGAEHIQDVEPWMASESMSLLVALYPGVFALLGIENEEKGTGAPHHNIAFDVDEDVLKWGAASAVAYALDFLNSDIDTSDRKWKGTMAELYKYGNRPQKYIDYLEGKTDHVPM